MQSVRLFVSLALMYGKQVEEMLCQNEETKWLKVKPGLHRKKPQRNPKRMAEENKPYVGKENY